MRTKVYEVRDHDILVTFFGDEAPVRRLAELGQDHGELIFDGEMSVLPTQDDTLLLDGAGGGMDEYIVIHRFYYADTDTATLIVHTPHYEEGVQS